MKEITATFENGAVFNGAANSLTLDNTTTFYFQTDQYFRVQVNLLLNTIILQEYKNTNGAWYPINTIKSVQVKEVITDNVVTKDYLEENYYNKKQVEDLIEEHESDVTKEYLEANYYNKATADGRYVFKAGDTMTGQLTIKYGSDGDYAEFTAHTINFRKSDNNYYMQFYRNNLNIYNGAAYIHDNAELNSTSLIVLDKGGLSIFDTAAKWIGGFRQESNYQYTALHIFNNGRIVMHTGNSGTTEQFMQISGANFNLYNASDTGAIRINAPTIVQNKFTTTSQFNANGANYFNGNCYFNAASYFNGLTLRTNTALRIGETNSYITISNAGLYIYSNGTKSVEVSNGRGVEMYGGKAVILHNDYNIQGKHTAYNWNNMTIYNFTSNDEWNLWLNAATVNWYCQRFFVYAANSVRIQSTNNDVEIAGNGGTVSAINAPQAINNEFFSNNFLNALNLFLEYMQDNIKSSVPNYSKVNEISFNSETFGGGFQAGGGSSRGGGVGRRSVS